MRRLVTAASVVTLALAGLSSVACSSARARDASADVESGPAPRLAPLAVAPSSTSGPLDASSLGRETGLAVEDKGNSVLLSNTDVLARFFPGSDRMSINGDMSSMGAAARRDETGFVIPAAGADAVRRAVAQARNRPQIQLWKPPPMAARPAPAPSSPSFVNIPTPRKSAYSGHGDAAWTVMSGSERAWRYIVIHHSDDESGCCAKYDEVHRRKGWDCCGYDFVIGNGTQSGDGQVEVGPRWVSQTTGAHAKTSDNRFNDYGVGIVLVGDFEHGCGPSARQYESLVRLTKWLMARYGISASNVMRHGDCKSTACPGRNFPWAKFLSDVS